MGVPKFGRGGAEIWAWAREFTLKTKRAAQARATNPITTLFIDPMVTDMTLQDANGYRLRPTLGFQGRGSETQRD